MLSVHVWGIGWRKLMAGTSGNPLYAGITGLLDRLSESVRRDCNSTVDYSINGNVFASPLVQPIGLVAFKTWKWANPFSCLELEHTHT
jgi:hypothetical protein